MQYRESHILPHQGPHWFSARSQRADVSFHLCLQEHKNERTQIHICSVCETTLTQKKKLLVLLKPHLANYIKHRKLSQGHLDSVLETVITLISYRLPIRRQQWLPKS